MINTNPYGRVEISNISDIPFSPTRIFNPKSGGGDLIHGELVTFTEP
jgi:hypothetical protein